MESQEKIPSKPEKELGIEDLRQFLEQKRMEPASEETSEMLPGFKDLRQIFGKEKLDKLFPTTSSSMAHYKFCSFSRQGWESAKEFFGKERSREALEKYKKADLFSFTKKQFEDLAGALEDQPPYNKTFDVLLNDWPRAWAEGVKTIEERKRFISPQEFEILLEQSETRRVLIDDGRRPDWPTFYYDKDKESVVGWEPNLKQNPVITPENWASWRSVFGDRWLDFLKTNPPADALEVISAETLKKIKESIPDLYERLSQEKEAELFLFELTSCLNMDEKIPVVLAELTPRQQEIFKQRTLREIGSFVVWREYDKLIWDSVLETCSPQYVEKILSEPVFLPDYLGTSGWRSRRARLTEKKLEDKYKELWALREKIDTALENNSDLARFIKENPSALPFLRLRYADALDKKMSRDVALLSAKELAGKIGDLSKEKFDETLVPSIGVEIEILEETPMAQDSHWNYVRTAFFGIPEGADEKWEFSVEPSNVSTQARYIAELIREGLIDPKWMTGGNYTLHISLGIPEEVKISEERAGILARVLMAAYGNKKRLAEGEYGALVEVHEPDSPARRKHKPRVGRETFSGRVEMRAFSLDRETIYRLLYDAAMLGSSCFAAERALPRNKKDEALAAIWRELETQVKTLLADKNIQWPKITIDEPREITDLLLAQPKIKKLAQEASRKIRQLAKKKK